MTTFTDVGVCLPVAVDEGCAVAVADLVEVGDGVVALVALGEGTGVEVLVTVADGVLVGVREGVFVSVSSNTTRALLVEPLVI